MHHYVSSSNNDHSCVRSLFYFGPWCESTAKEWKWLFNGFKLVRVLDTGRISCRKTPSNLGVFIHLRYLRLFVQYVRIIPASICTLSNLQTLDIAWPVQLNNDFWVSFPAGMWKLKQLRHVYTPEPIMLHWHRWESDEEIMWNLQTISFIEFNKQTASLIEKGRFPRLRKLGLLISSNDKHKLPKLLQSLQKLGHLSKVQITLEYSLTPNFYSMEWNNGCKPQELLQSLQPLSRLTTLKITTALDLLTCAAAFPPYITNLTLERIYCLNNDGMNALGNLTKLRILRLSGTSLAADFFEFNCIAGMFPQLQVFHMRYLKLQNWKLDNGAMPCLQSLVIDNCKRLDDLPDELWSLTDLREVKVLQPSQAMAFVLENLKTEVEFELIICEDNQRNVIII